MMLVYQAVLLDSNIKVNIYFIGRFTCSADVDMHENENKEQVFEELTKKLLENIEFLVEMDWTKEQIWQFLEKI